MKIFSAGFANQEKIPVKYTCDNNDINPPIGISEAPKNAKSLALIMDDPDAPSGRWIHWLLWNIDPSTSAIEENSIPRDALSGKNDFNKIQYGGPCPQTGMHRYVFTLYALDKKLDLREGSTVSDLEIAMDEHIIEKAELVGVYTRENGSQ